MAKSGHCNSHNPQRIHSFGALITGFLLTFLDNTCLGHIAAQMPHALHKRSAISGKLFPPTPTFCPPLEKRICRFSSRSLFHLFFGVEDVEKCQKTYAHDKKNPAFLPLPYLYLGLVRQDHDNFNYYR
jgi:hypothetical protein